MSFKPNRFFLSQLSDTAGARAEKAAAEEAKSKAETISPYGPGDQAGHYRDHFVVVEDENGHYVLGNTDWKAHFIEWGTSRGFPAFGILRRAAILAGCEFEPKGPNRAGPSV